MRNAVAAPGPELNAASARSCGERQNTSSCTARAWQPTRSGGDDGWTRPHPIPPQHRAPRWPAPCGRQLHLAAAGAPSSSARTTAGAAAPSSAPTLILATPSDTAASSSDSASSAWTSTCTGRCNKCSLMASRTTVDTHARPLESGAASGCRRPPTVRSPPLP
jgi:hypothetical protein